MSNLPPISRDSIPSPSDSNKNIEGSKEGSPLYKSRELKGRVTVINLKDLKKTTPLIKVAKKINEINQTIGWESKNRLLGTYLKKGVDKLGRDREFLLALNADRSNEISGYLQYYKSDEGENYVSFIGVMHAFEKEKKTPGVGTAMMQSFIQTSRENGIEKCFVDCRKTKEGKETGLPTFYEKMAEKANCGVKIEDDGKYRNGDPAVKVTYILDKEYTEVNSKIG